jgi:hypothetical protein
MKTSEIKLQVKFKFEGEYPEERVQELMTKIADALHHEYASGNGFAPEDVDGVLTEGTEIKCGDKVVIDNYYDKHVKGRYTHTLDFSGHD